MKKQKGFTLIELVTALTITIIVTVSITLMGGYWINNSKALSTEAQLNEAITRAQSHALRNTNGVYAGEPAIFLINNEGILKICTEATCANLIWQTVLPTNTQIELESGKFSCLTFDNQGILINYQNCTTNSSYEIKSRTASIEGKI